MAINKQDSAPLTIGVFDSGVGGFTVARALLEVLPGMHLIYHGDTAHVPYGPRPLAEVQGFAVQIIEFLFAQGADAVVMGCNMSIASGAREVAMQRTDKPIFEIIQPGSKAACAISACGNIGVIATQGTVKTGIYGRTLRENGAATVHEQACPKFVPLVEQGLDDGPAVEDAVAEYLPPLKAAGIDTLVFGCTHYPFLETPISRFLGSEVALVDPGRYAAVQVAEYFADSSSARVPNHDAARHRFYCSGDPESLRREGERFLGIPIRAVERVNVPVDKTGG